MWNRLWTGGGVLCVVLLSSEVPVRADEKEAVFEMEEVPEFEQGEGKVVSVWARGAELTRQLEQLIGLSRLETIVPVGSTWKCLNVSDGVDPATGDEDFHTTFFDADYDESHWQTGRDSAGRSGGFGYSDAGGVVWDRPTAENRKTAYLRHRFRTDIRSS
ncbi:MAG: hypothetical protein A2V70_12260 [Planctomycetes bacterium RBG_13_63_9]|nr:MAG: hypothetical protein A2V70_12260 [Planctomycetes bacterium RBG_13_63_9]